MHVVHIAPEMAPYAKVGGLGDVVGSLPVAQRREGHRVTVVMPGYKSVMEQLDLWSRVEAATAYGLAGENVGGTVHRFDHDGVDVRVVWQDRFFDRPGVYGDSHGSYGDNGDRFAWFCGAAVNVARQLDEPPDAIACHDWPAALAPVLLRAHPIADDPLAHTATVFVIHNLAHQGVFPFALADRIGLPDLWLDRDGLSSGGQLNLLKGAIRAATLVVTVSPTYARQILSAAHGRGLEGELRAREPDVFGILNGLDVAAWDPATDPHLAAPYEPDRLDGKRACKAALQREAGLRVDESLPLFGVVSRIDAQKGIDLIGRIAPWLVETSSQLVVLGTGQGELLEELRGIAGHWRQSVALLERFDEALAHRIYAGADFFLMPSRFEPCGLGQLVALRYGTIPIVHRTGGLADTVRDLDAESGDGNGFVFEVIDTAGLRWAVGRALALFHENPERLARARTAAMREDLSWAASARRHLEILGLARERERSRVLD